MKVLENNLLLSPGLKNGGRNQLIIKRNYRSASSAYNEAIDEAENEIIIFVHQDVYFPDQWFTSLEQALSYFEKENIEWGTLGCFGTREKNGKAVSYGCIYSNGWGIIGHAITKPEQVQTLDEIVLVIRKSSGLRFDQDLPYFHMYGTDICLSSREKGMNCYVIPAFCVHNTNQLLELPREFFECYRHIRKRWAKYLPVYTPCIRIARSNRDIYLRKLREVYARLQRKEYLPAKRVEDPRTLLRAVLSQRDSEDFSDTIN